MAKLGSMQPKPATHRLEAALSGLWFLVNLAFGALAAGFLAWGPLALAPPWVAAFGLAGGLLNGSLWARQRLAAGRWRRGLLLGHLTIALLVGLIATVQLYRVGLLPPHSADRVAAFERLWRAIDAHYPYFELKGVDWPALRARYLPLVQAAESDREYHASIAAMLAELDDAHTGLIAPALDGRYALVEEVEGQAVVTQAGAVARAAGLERGTLLQAVNGRPVQEALAALPPHLQSGSTPQQRRYRAYQHLLSIPLGEELVVHFEAPGGEQRSATLAWPPASGSQAAQAALPSPVQSERLPSGLGLIRIASFGRQGSHDLVAEFDTALDGLMEAPGLILDLRGNGGGDSSLADRIAGRFLAQPTIYGREHYRVRLPLRGWRPWWDYTVRPRLPVYTGPLVLLIDTGNMSTAETFIVSLVDSGRAQTVGRPTGGASGNPVAIPLPGGGRARFSTGDFHRNDGRRIEGAGIEPDVTVAWTLDDVRAGCDPDLAAAERLLAARSD
jgi:carboxyl-terminal processing protease